MKFLIVEPPFTSVFGPNTRLKILFLNTLSLRFLNKDRFYSVSLLASRQTLKLEDHSWSAVHDCLFNIFAANLHIWRPTPPSATQGTRHAVVTGTHGWEVGTTDMENKLVTVAE